MKNKIISISLIASIFIQGIAQPLSAFSLSDVQVSNFRNVTSGGEWEKKDSDGKTILSTFTTKSVFFRFGPSMSRIEPIVQTGSPSMGASCSGFNLKGMFIRILGLDRIAKMLKSAGSSFAWGILIGLIYSLPGVASTFNMINAWAKKIQELLQNACQGGQVVGRMIADNTYGPSAEEAQTGFDNFMKDLTPESALNVTENGYKEKIMTGAMKVEKFFGADVEEEDDIAPTKEEFEYWSTMELLRYGLQAQQGLFIGNLNKLISQTMAHNPAKAIDLVEYISGKKVDDMITSKFGAEVNYIQPKINNINTKSIKEMLNQSGLPAEHKLTFYLSLIISAIADIERTTINEEHLKELILNKEATAKIIDNNTSGGVTSTESITEKASLSSNEKDSKKVDLEKIGTTIGKLFAYSILGISTSNKTNILSSLKEEFKILNTIGSPHISFIYGVPSPKGAASSSIGLFSNISGTQGNFFSDNFVSSELSSAPESIHNRYIKYFDSIVRDVNPLDISTAALSANVIDVVNFPNKYVAIISQSDADGQSRLKDAFVTLATCMYVDGFKKSLSNIVLGGNEGVVYKLSATHMHEISSNSFAKTDKKSIDTDFSGLLNNFKNAAIEVIDAEPYSRNCEKASLDELRNKFDEQDSKNRSKAQMKSLQPANK